MRAREEYPVTQETHETHDPLEALLRILATEQAITLRGVAERLDVAEATIEQMLETLRGAGYLRVLSASCDGHCARCASSATCGLFSGSRIWAVTERGHQALAAGQHQ